MLNFHNATATMAKINYNQSYDEPCSEILNNPVLEINGKQYNDIGGLLCYEVCQVVISGLILLTFDRLII